MRVPEVEMYKELSCDATALTVRKDLGKPSCTRQSKIKMLRHLFNRLLRLHGLWFFGLFFILSSRKALLSEHAICQHCFTACWEVSQQSQKWMRKC